jgi:chromosome segregation ATPase
MKAVNIILTLVVIGLVGVSAFLIATIQKNHDLKKQNEEITAYVDDATKTISDIQSSLDNISADTIKNISSNPELPDSAMVDKKGRIMTRIDQLNSQMEAYKSKISDLEKKLNNNSIKIRGLEQLVEKLKVTLAQKEELIATLSGKVNELSQTLETERVTAKNEIAARQQALTESKDFIKLQDEMINTVYYITGTQKDLITKGILEKTGGLLGIGRSIRIKRNFKTEEFSTLNLLNEQAININYPMKKVLILSAQSASSYEVLPVNDNQTKLQVLKPEIFRQNKYVVVMVK